MSIWYWIAFGVVLLAGVAGVVYWLRAAMREWELFEELLINDLFEELLINDRKNK